MRMKQIVVFLLCSMIPIAASAQEAVYETTSSDWNMETVSIDGLNYYLDATTNEATIAAENKWTGELVLPSCVSYDNQEYTVTGIHWLAFCQCETLTRVTIPKTVNHVYSVSVYPEAAMNPFINCSCLEYIEVEDGNPLFCSVGGILFTSDMSKLCSYPTGARSESYVIPDGVKAIGGAAFYGNTWLRSVTMPSTVTKEYGSIFYGCSNLEEVRLSESLTYVEASSFSGCLKLESLLLPVYINGVGDYAFSDCMSLKELELPENTSYIANFAFANSGIEKLVIRGKIDNYLNSNVFKGMKENTTLYVLPEEINRYKSIYGGEVLPLEEYTSSVNQINVSHGTSRGFASDLMGRRLNTSETKGIFVKSGKKYIKR